VCVWKVTHVSDTCVDIPLVLVCQESIDILPLAVFITDIIVLWRVDPAKQTMKQHSLLSIQRGLEHGSRGIAIVGSVTRQLRAGKDLACVTMICKV
jgi:hypothetical protein